MAKAQEANAHARDYLGLDDEHDSEFHDEHEYSPERELNTQQSTAVGSLRSNCKMRELRMEEFDRLFPDDPGKGKGKGSGDAGKGKHKGNGDTDIGKGKDKNNRSRSRSRSRSISKTYSLPSGMSWGLDAFPSPDDSS